MPAAEAAAGTGSGLEHGLALDLKETALRCIADFARFGLVPFPFPSLPPAPDILHSYFDFLPTVFLRYDYNLGLASGSNLLVIMVHLLLSRMMLLLQKLLLRVEARTMAPMLKPSRHFGLR